MSSPDKQATSHYVEAAIWLILAAFLFNQTFSFNQEIEIYRYGAAAWPRTIIILMAIAAIGQLIYNRTRANRPPVDASPDLPVRDRNSLLLDTSTSRTGHAPVNAAWPTTDQRLSWTRDSDQADMDSQSTRESPANQAEDPDNTGLKWYIHTFFLVALPFVYINLPKILAGTTDVGSPELNRYKLIVAGLVSVVFIVAAWRNHLGAVLALPVLFAAMMQDLGFYALAPVFILGVMFLMGERRIHWMVSVMMGIYAIIMTMFVVILYVGLPTGYVRPFYDFGTWMVKVLQL